MKLIDADALKHMIESMNFAQPFMDVTRVLYGVGIEIDNAPTIDLVRCSECRKVREDGGHANCNGYLYCRKWKTLVDEDDYCSWGEREDE